MTVHGAKGLEAPVVFLDGHDIDAARQRAPEPDPLSVRQRYERRAGLRGLGRAQGGRPGCRAAGAPAHGGRYRTRVSPPALCGDDARCRTADHRRRAARQPQRGTERLLVPACHTTVSESRNWSSTRIETEDGGVRRFTRPEDTFAPVERAAARRRRLSCCSAAALAARESLQPSHRRSSCRRPSDADDDEGHRFARGESPQGPAARTAPRRAGAPTAAVVAGHRQPIAAARRRNAISRATPPDWTDAEREALAAQTTRPDRRCPLRHAVCAGQPRRGADRRPNRAAGPASRLRFPARSTG